MTKKRAFILISFSFFLLFLLSSFASAADVAYIYSKTFKIDNNIISAFNDLNLSVDLINVNSISSNITSYKILFIGDEKFKNITKIPFGNIPTIFANYYHGEIFGLTDNEGISQLVSNSPLSVKKNNSVIQVYTRASEIRRRAAIPYYYIDYNNIASAMQPIARTYVIRAGYTNGNTDLGAVIAYAEKGAVLETGKALNGNLCFFGIVRSDYWTNNARELFKECIGFVKPAYIPPIIACNSTLDCPGDSFSSNFCSDYEIHRIKTNYTCVNPSTPESYCNKTESEEIIEFCEETCSNGQCIDIPCSDDADCPSDSFIGNNMCLSNSSFGKEFADYFCVNPGEVNSSCDVQYSNITEAICEP